MPLDSLFARCPSDRIRRLGGTGLRFHAETPWFLIIAFGATLGLGILGWLTSTRSVDVGTMSKSLVIGAGGKSPAVRVVLRVFAWTMFAGAVACVVGFAAARERNVEIAVEGFAVRRARTVGGWRLAINTVECEDVAALLVVENTGRRRLVLAGARNVELMEVVAERWSDPPGMLDWTATWLVAALGGRTGSA